MICFYPHEDSTERITWYGGESTMLRYEVQVTDDHGDPVWIEWEAQTLGNGIPTGTKELLAAMSDYYQYISTMELDTKAGTIF